MTASRVCGSGCCARAGVADPTAIARTDGSIQVRTVDIDHLPNRRRFMDWLECETQKGEGELWLVGTTALKCTWHCSSYLRPSPSSLPPLERGSDGFEQRIVAERL